ncbi:MAG: hypothetical protein JWQ16_2105, partial [Novosphingobium sp.]|nr:hypothetical protein [Novosphingobium sp.]
MRKAVQLIALALIAAPGVAQAAEPPCLTAREFTDLSSYALPSIITGTAERCSASLGPSAFLKRDGGALASRYAAAKPAAWPGAKSAFFKLSGGANSDAASLFRNMPDNKLQPMVDSLVEGLIAQQVPAERCRTIDPAVRLLSPLPPQNTAELI